MKQSDTSAAVYRIPEATLVPQFDPRRFLKMTATGPKLDLGIKKTWFRLKYPEGRILVRPLSITDRIAQMEAQVYARKTDTAPLATSDVQYKAEDVPGGLYVQAAQHDAIERALDTAGFTLIVGTASADTTIQRPTPKSNPEPAPVSPPPAPEPVKDEIRVEAPPAVTVVDVPDPVETVEIAEDTPVQQASILETFQSSASTDSEAPISDDSTDPPYTENTPVEEILEKMTLEEARNTIITWGACTGWTMADALVRRKHSVIFFATPGYKGDDNRLRASAKILLADGGIELAS